MSDAETLRADVCVLGGGAAGLSVAAGAAMFGLDVVLFEPGAMGGECLNTGCVPSKALLAAAADGADFATAMTRVREAIAAIEPHDSQERFEGLGVRVMREAAWFEDRRTVASDTARVRFRWAVVATGSRPALPDVPGLLSSNPLTNDTLWELEAAPESLLILGGGPMGVEMAQAFARLGTTPTLIEQAPEILPGADPDHAAVVRRALEADGVRVFTGARAASFAAAEEGVAATLETRNGRRSLAAERLLVAAGRAAAVEGLQLDRAGVDASRDGVAVDARLRTANRRVFAAGDVAAGRARLTHAAGYEAGVILRNIAFRLPSKAAAVQPQAVFTSPELAWIGMGESEAVGRCGEGRIRVASWPFAKNDRAQAERDTAGEVKVVAKTNGEILGVSVVGAQAGEIINLAALAMASKLKVRALTAMIAPYPTRGEALKRAAGAWYEPVVFGPLAKGAARLLARAP